jgi:hypothetical protein
MMISYNGIIWWSYDLKATATISQPNLHIIFTDRDNDNKL